MRSAPQAAAQLLLFFRDMRSNFLENFSAALRQESPSDPFLFLSSIIFIFQNASATRIQNEQKKPAILRTDNELPLLRELLRRCIFCTFSLLQGLSEHLFHIRVMWYQKHDLRNPANFCGSEQRTVVEEQACRLLGEGACANRSSRRSRICFRMKTFNRSASSRCREGVVIQ